MPIEERRLPNSATTEDPAMPQWFSIVKCYPDFHNGPTVPFLLGSLQDPIGALFGSEDLAKDRLRWLLATMREQARAGSGVRLQWCGPTHAHVVADQPLLDGFYWDPIDGCEIPDLDRLFEKVWEHYGSEIIDGAYSITNREWNPFTPEEREKIKATLVEAR